MSRSAGTKVMPRRAPRRAPRARKASARWVISGKDRRDALAARAAEVAEALGDGPVALAVAEAASRYWDYDGADPSDFCLQDGGSVIVEGAPLTFGAGNRLHWCPWDGFRADPSRSCAAFVNRASVLGPCPGRMRWDES